MPNYSCFMLVIEKILGSKGNRKGKWETRFVRAGLMGFWFGAL